MIERCRFATRRARGHPLASPPPLAIAPVISLIDNISFDERRYTRQCGRLYAVRIPTNYYQRGLRVCSRSSLHRWPVMGPHIFLGTRAEARRLLFAISMGHASRAYELFRVMRHYRLALTAASRPANGLPSFYGRNFICSIATVQRHL